MSVLAGMSTAISGLEANSQSLAVISDNIVNSNTNGFKSARGEFQNILGQDLGIVSSNGQIGRGVTMAGITTRFSQGPITKTERGTDLAVSGNGFFTLMGPRGMTFTRDGAFRFDKDGWLVNLNGARVQAYEATGTGKITGKLGDIRVPFNTINAKATNNLEVHFNLDARAQAGPPLDLARPDETANFTSGIQMYDSIGNNHAVGMYFNKLDESTWEWYAMVDGSEVLGGVEGEPSAVATGTLLFDQEGKLEAYDQTLLNTSFTNGAIADQDLQFDFGDPTVDGGTGMRGTTQYGSKSVMFRNIQDGYSAGALADINIDSEGITTGIYTNGVTKTLGQIAMARFEATERLQKVGENQFRESIESGPPLLGRPNTNGRGTLMSKSLEGSNVDLAREFVEMIRSQRGFQASAKSITTANTLLDEVISLIR